MKHPVIEVLPTYIAAGEGYILIDHRAYNPTELAEQVIMFAAEVGFDAPQTPIDEVWEGEFLNDVEAEAIDYLNDHHAPNGSWWGHDGEAGAFGCWPNTEDDA